MNDIYFYLFLGGLFIACLFIFEIFIRSNQLLNKHHTEDMKTGNEALPQQVSQELSSLRLPAETVKEATRSISQMVDREVKIRTEKAQEEMKGSYEKIMKSYNDII